VHAGRLRRVARERSKAGEVVTSDAVVYRPSQWEADAYVRAVADAHVRAVAVAHRNDGAIATMPTLSLRPAHQRGHDMCGGGIRAYALWYGLWWAASRRGS